MEEEAKSTKEKIERCALKEFLEKGFNGASLRQIVKDAGVTTGAFYKYYPTKEALFEALVKPCVDHIYEMYDRNYEKFAEQDLSGQISGMRENAGARTDELVTYLYAHHDTIKLLLTASEGTVYADFVHNLAEREAKSALAFADLMKKNGLQVRELDEEFVHMMASGMFSAIFEIVLHDMDRKKASIRIALLEEFYTAGWEKILGVTF